MTLRQVVSRRYFSFFGLAAASALVLKLYWAYTTPGAADISLWLDFVKHIQECGNCVYERGGLMTYPGGHRLNPFNHPPFMLHVLRLLDWISSSTGLPFRFVLRATTSGFDVGSLIVLYHLLKRSALFDPKTYFLYLLSPATLIISGYHGNTDTLMILLVLLCALSVESNKPTWLSGATFGLALSIKIVPVLFAPVLFFYLIDFKKRIEFFCAAALIFIVASSPYLFEDPILILRSIFGYGSFPGRWGWTRILLVATNGEGIYRMAIKIGTFLPLLLIVIRSYKINGNRRPPLLVQLGCAVFIFMSATAGWGANYMAWLDPFAPVLGLIPAFLYYLTSGAMLGYLYFIKDDESTKLVEICWGTVLVVTYLYLRLRKPDKSNEQPEKMAIAKPDNNQG